jgi:hypothetical protein
MEQLVEFNGIIQKKFANNFRGKQLNSFSLKGTDGFFNTAEVAIGFPEGASVSFQATQGNKPGNYVVDVSTVAGTENAPVTTYRAPPVPQRTGGAVRSAGGIGKDEYWSNKEERDIKVQKIIQLQAARNAAIAYLAAVGMDHAIQTVGDPAMFVQKWTETFLSQNVEPTEGKAEEVLSKVVGEWN